MKQKRIIILFSLLMLFVPLMIGQVNNVIAAEKILKVGTTLPLSGPAAGWGLGLSRMNDFFAEDINKAGGLKIGKDVYTIKTISYDHKGSPSEAAANATRLVSRDKIQYLIGGVIAATGMAELPITQPAKVITTSLWWGKEILGPDKPYSFRQTISQNEIAPAMYTWIARNNPKIKKVAQINPNDTSGWDTAAAVRETAKANGMEIVAEEFFERGTKDMYPFLTRILAKKPDLIDVAVTAPGDGAMIVKQLYELGYKGAKAWTCGTNPIQIIQLCGTEAAEGLWFAYGQDLEGPKSSPETRALAKRYMAKFNEPLAPHHVTSYAMLEIFTQAMVKAGTTDTDAVSKVVEKTHKFNTSFGPFVLVGKQKYGIDRQFVHRMMLAQARGGKVVEIEWLPLPGLGLPEY
ncbi:MAG: ABC transporter substrate-binding protein [Proteobacteria bacterium]|nr:ABC transporter substrate-binding protein [Pseudomonadota bacterium]